MSPRRNKNTTPVPEPEPVAVDISALVSEKVTAELLKQQHRKVVQPFRCQSCWVLSNNAAMGINKKICSRCENFGFQADIQNYVGRSMGWVTGIPTELIPTLKKTLTEAEIWDASPAELAEVWDKNSTELLPTKVSTTDAVSNNRFVTVAEFSDYQPTPPRLRPPTEQERNEYLEQARKQKEQDTARRSAARRKVLDRNLSRAQEAINHEETRRG